MTAPKNPKITGKIAAAARNNNGAVIVGVLVAATFIGIVVAAMLQSTRGQGMFSQSYTTVYNAQMAVSNGIMATESFFNTSDSATIISLVNKMSKNPSSTWLFGKTSERDKVTIDKDQKFSSEFVNFVSDANGQPLTKPIAEFKIVSDKGLREARAYYEMSNLKRGDGVKQPGTGPWKNNAVYAKGGAGITDAGIETGAGSVTIETRRIGLQNGGANFAEAAYFERGFKVPTGIKGGHIIFDSHLYSGPEGGVGLANRSEVNTDSLTVRGDAWFDNEFYVDGGKVTFEKKTYFRENVTIRAPSEFKDDAYFENGAELTNATFHKKVFVGGTADFRGTNSFAGDAYFGGNATIASGTFDGKVFVREAAAFSGTNSFAGDARFNSTLSANNATFTGRLAVSGNAVLTGSAGNVENDAYFGAALNAAGGTFGGGMGEQGRVYVHGLTTLDGGTVTFQKDAYFNNNLVTGTSATNARGVFNGKVYVAGDVRLLNEGNRFANDVYFSDSLTIRASTFEGKVFIGRGVTLSKPGRTTFDRDVYIGGRLVTDAGDASGTFNGNVYVGGFTLLDRNTSDVSRRTIFNGATVLNGSLGSSSASTPTPGKGIEFLGNTHIKGNVTLANVDQNQSPIIFHGDLRVDGDKTGGTGGHIVTDYAFRATGNVYFDGSKLGTSINDNINTGPVSIRMNPGKYFRHVGNITSLPSDVTCHSCGSNQSVEYEQVTTLPEVIAAADRVQPGHVTKINAYPESNHVSPIVLAISRDDVHKTDLADLQEPEFSPALIASLATATTGSPPRAVAVGCNDVAIDGSGNSRVFSLENLKTAYTNAKNQGRLYNGHLVVNMDCNELTFSSAASRGTFEDKVMFIVGSGKKLNVSERNFYESGLHSSTMIYVGQGGTLENFGSNHFFRGYIYIASGATKANFQWGDGKCWEGALHAMNVGGTQGGISWDYPKSVKIYYNEELLNPFVKLLQGHGSADDIVSSLGATGGISSVIPSGDMCYCLQLIDPVACNNLIASQPSTPPPTGDWEFDNKSDPRVPMSLIGVYYGKSSP